MCERACMSVICTLMTVCGWAECLLGQTQRELHASVKNGACARRETDN